MFLLHLAATLESSHILFAVVWRHPEAQHEGLTSGPFDCGRGFHLMLKAIWFLQLHQPSRLYQHSSVSLAMQDTASTVEWSKDTLFGRHPTATKSSAAMKNQHETFPAGCNGCSSEDAEGLFWNQSLKPASLLGKNVASLHGKFRSPPKNLLGIIPLRSSFHLRRWRNQKIPWLQWWRSDNNWRRQNSLKKHLKHLEFLPNLTEKLSPWIDSCSVSVRFGSITGPWKWCNQNPWVFLLDPGSPKEGPGLWRRWGRSVFKRFPHRLTKLWNTMVWSHCFWLETHKKPGKRMGNTLQWLNWQTSVFWTFNCQQTGEPPSENFWGFLFCESFSIPGEDRQGVETGDPKDLSVPRQGDQPSNNLIGFPQCSLRANELLEKWRNLGFANDLD